MATIFDNTDTEHFHPCKKFYWLAPSRAIDLTYLIYGYSNRYWRGEREETDDVSEGVFETVQ